MCLATCANMINNTDGTDARTIASTMISHKVLAFVQFFTENTTSDDEDMVADAKLLQEKLEIIFEVLYPPASQIAVFPYTLLRATCVFSRGTLRSQYCGFSLVFSRYERTRVQRGGHRAQDMSSFDEYASEVSSGLLEWSPVHRSEKFWRENVERLNDDRHKLVKILIQLLETSTDPKVLAVAAHDVGEYVRHYPRGKQVLDTLGGKQYIMMHMSHDDKDVRYEALIAVQKVMTQNWGALGKKIDQGA